MRAHWTELALRSEKAAYRRPNNFNSKAEKQPLLCAVTSPKQTNIKKAEDTAFFLGTHQEYAGLHAPGMRPKPTSLAAQ